ncbi:protein of unknown function [Candidatus Promineifilum breve]|uniref:Uncharacterized protein n=1 Tax=Candidatus Promineifilum breve TaxID=1806508 RepID=A0A160T5G0_9CHLR|nr:protein of unknown function [Candidatus Promineifilum breve]
MAGAGEARPGRLHPLDEDEHPENQADEHHHAANQNPGATGVLGRRRRRRRYVDHGWRPIDDDYQHHQSNQQPYHQTTKHQHRLIHHCLPLTRLWVVLSSFWNGSLCPSLGRPANRHGRLLVKKGPGNDWGEPAHLPGPTGVGGIREPARRRKRPRSPRSLPPANRRDPPRVSSVLRCTEDEYSVAVGSSVSASDSDTQYHNTYTIMDMPSYVNRQWREKPVDWRHFNV